MSSNSDFTGKVCLFYAFYSINPLTFNDIHSKKNNKKNQNILFASTTFVMLSFKY